MTQVIHAEDSAPLRLGLERLLVNVGHDIVRAVDNVMNPLSAITLVAPDLALAEVRRPPPLPTRQS